MSSKRNILLCVFLVGLLVAGIANSIIRRYRSSEALKYRVYTFESLHGVTADTKDSKRLHIPPGKYTVVAIDDPGSLEDCVSFIKKVTSINKDAYIGLPVELFNKLTGLGDKSLKIRNLVLDISIEGDKMPRLSALKSLIRLRVIVGHSGKKEFIKSGGISKYRLSPNEKDYLARIVSDVCSLKNVRELVFKARYFDIDLSCLNKQQYLKKLSVSSSALILPDNIGSIRTLVVSCMKMDDYYRKIAGYRDLRELQFDLSTLPDTVKMPGLPALISLDMSYNSFKSVKFGSMPQLENLNLEFCSRLEDIEGLDQMLKLNFLNVSFTRIEDLDFIPKYSHLSYLNLANCRRIKDFFPLAKLTGLRTLDISECNIKNKNFPGDKLPLDCQIIKDQGLPLPL